MAVEVTWARPGLRSVNLKAGKPWPAMAGMGRGRDLGHPWMRWKVDQQDRLAARPMLRGFKPCHHSVPLIPYRFTILRPY